MTGSGLPERRRFLSRNPRLSKIRTGPCANWLAESIVNYHNASDLSLLTNLFERPGAGTSHFLETGESRQIVDVGLDKVDVPVLFQAIHDRFRVDRDSIQFVYNDDRLFFVHSYSGRVLSAALSQPKTHGLSAVEPAKVRLVRNRRRHPEM